MSKVKASLPSGTRDFLPQEVAKRNYLFSVINSVFEKYGFQQIETPVLENLSTLTGKYGEEGDQLLFKVLNSGDFLKDANAETLANKDSKKLTSQIADRGLRYDLTVPLARYVVQHQGDLTFPFKRYHIAPVWRADRPQKGRYREFYQCDADVIGSDSLLNEVELTNIFAEVFSALKLNVTIRINSRKILEAIAVFAGVREQLTALTTAIDKFDKVGLDGVIKELEQRGFSAEKAEKIKTILQIKSLEDLQKIIGENEGIAELKTVFGLANLPNLEFDITLARGLNYYTGVIWEIKSNDTQIGSIGSGGRYANLTEMFGGQNMSGVGISFGVERIYDVMNELNLFPDTVLTGVQILFVAREPQLESFAFEQVQKLRTNNISAELFLGNAKKQKHFSYAESKGIAFMVEVGSDEKENGIFRCKNLKTREEQRLNIDAIISFLSTKQ